MGKDLPPVVRWRKWSGSGFEHVLLVENGGLTEARSVVISGPDESAPDGFAALYSIRLDSEWRVMEVTASIHGKAESLHLRRTESGKWLNGEGAALPALDGAFDVDLSITPLTNTIPVRRLGLAIGESAKITAAYVAFPQLVVSLDPQRYTRLTADRYRYESMDTDFVREITVDEHGLVLTYPDLFRRA